MSKWVSLKLKDIVDSANTGLDAIRRAPIVEEDTGIKCLRIQDVSQSKPFERWGNSKVNAKDYERAQLRTDDLIMARTCSPGIVYHVRHDLRAVFNNGLARIRPDTSKTSSLFLYYVFKSPDFIGHIYGISGGTSVQLNMKLGDLLSYEMTIPSLEEQKVIAAVLSSLDDKIDLLHRQNQTLEAMAATLFRQWFVEEAQEDWEEAVLDDVISVKGGTTPSTKEPKYWDGTIHWTTPRDLSSHNSVFLFDTERKITEKGLSQIGSGLIPVGAVLLSSRAPIGYLAIADIPVAINQGYIAIVCDKLVSNYFMYLWCKANMDAIKNAGNGSTFEEISKSSFKALGLVIPPKNKLMEFDKAVLPSFEKIRTNKRQIRTLEKLRDTLLPKLMSGEVRVV